jgi:uncharacterized protein
MMPIRWALARALTPLLFAAPAACLAWDATPATRLDADLRCRLGAYGLATAMAPDAVTITGLDGQPRALRYTLSDGRFGDLKEAADGSFSGGPVAIRFDTCTAGNLALTVDGATRPGQRLPMAEQLVRFSSDGIELQGKLVLPPGGDAQALAVWVEGSNNNPASDDSVWPHELARRGVAVFVYDKRGTGSSAGPQTSDFHARARDTAAALQAAQRLAPGIRRVGVIGASQGGWVAPLVATLQPLDFVVTAFALADGPIAQDQAIVADQLRGAGFGETEQREARALTAITERIVRSSRFEGLEALDTFKVRHAGAPWLAALQPRSYTGLLLQFTSDQIRAVGPALAQGLPFDFDPGPVIASIPQRQLWLLGGRDRQAPNAKTQLILRQLQQRGRPIAVAVFPRADHGLIESMPTAHGTVPAYAPRMFDLTADWILRGQTPALGTLMILETTHVR